MHLVGHHTASAPPVHPSSAEIAGTLRPFADLLDGLMNTFTSAQAVPNPQSRAMREAAALSNLEGHPTTMAVNVWLDQAMDRGDENAQRIAKLLERFLEHAHEVMEHDKNAAKRLLILLPRQHTHAQVSNLVAVGTVTGQALRALAEHQESTAAAVSSTARVTLTQERHPHVPALSDDYVAATSGKRQRLLLRAVNGKGRVLIEDVLAAVYGSKDKRNLDALMKVKERVNRRLTQDDQGHEVRREGETLVLSTL
jgi:hypothetical protein